MAQVLLFISIISLLLVLAYQDMTTRSIHIAGLGLLSVGIAVFAFMQHPLNLLIRYAAFNFSFLLIQFLLVSLYFSIKEKKLLSIADKYLGWGDILFLIPVCLLFSPFNFILYYLAAIVFTLIGFLLWQLINRNAAATIPLVSGMAVILIAALLGSYLGIYDRYTDLIVYLAR